MKNGIKKQEQKNLDTRSHFAILNTGAILDKKYEIIREVGRGGMGIVYEAYHKYTHKRVAIKVILDNEVDSIRLKRFQKELEAYSVLSHPNVITIHDAGIYNNYPYIVMEYIEGVDIYTYVQYQEKKKRQEAAKNAKGKYQGRDWQLCARLIYETALGLDYIHSQKMIHRDIKPTNIMVKPNGSPVIIDLGLVKFNRTQSYNLTKSKGTIGTFEYMSIEQAQGKGEQIDARTDVYSLGLVLYKLLTGKVAYSGENMLETCYKIMFYYPPLPREINPRIPEVLEEITILATYKQKEKRYASMKEFADALKKYLDDPTVKPTPQYAQIQQKLLKQRNKNKIFNSSYRALNKQRENRYASMEKFEDALRKYLDATTATSIQQRPKQTNRITILRVIVIISLFLMVITSLFSLIQFYKPTAEENFQLAKELYSKKNFKEAVELYKKSANQEHAEAQFNLGRMYEKGDGVKQDYTKAVEWYEKAKNQGYENAKFYLKDICYKLGGECEKRQDYENAVEWYKKATEQGHIKAKKELKDICYNLGVKFEERQDYEKAVIWYEQAAKQGDAEAQYRIGVIYKDIPNYEEAVIWYEKAANQGHAEAQANLKYIYYNLGVKYQKIPNYEEAVIWYEKAANQGHANAQHNLGVICYNLGSECYERQDYEEAVIWYEKAVIWYEKVAKQGHANAQYNLGVICYNLGKMYETGEGVKQDYAKAVEWYEQSANQGYAEAKSYLLVIYYKLGDECEKRQDYVKAREWYEQSANQGYAEAQKKLKELEKRLEELEN